MTKPKTLLTRRLVEEPMARLRARTDATINLAGRAMTRAELLAAVADVEGLLCMVTDRVDAELFDAAPRLRVVANHAVGYDNIDVAAATERGIWVANTPDVLTDATADLAALPAGGEPQGGGGRRLLCVRARGVVGNRCRCWALACRAACSGWSEGRIGRAVARRAQAFGMQVLYWNRTRLTPAEEVR